MEQNSHPLSEVPKGKKPDGFDDIVAHNWADGTREADIIVEVDRTPNQVARDTATADQFQASQSRVDKQRREPRTEDPLTQQLG